MSPFPRPARSAAASLLAAALCLLAAGCSIGSRRITPSVYPFDPRLDCLFGDRHVVTFLVDGCRADLLADMVRAGELPTIRRYFAERGVSADCAVTTVPSTTNAAVAALLCGAYPGRLNIIGNRWFDRSSPRRVSVLGLNDYGLDRDYLARRTIYEILGDELTVSLFSRLPEGSAYEIPIYYNLIGMKYFLLGNWRKVDEVFVREFEDVAAIADREGVFPAFSFFHLAGCDAVAHHTGSFSPEARGMLTNIDRALAPVMEALERNGVLDRVCLVLTADHGQVPIGAHRLLWERYFPERLGLPALGCAGGADRPGDGRFTRYAVVAAVNGRNSFLHFRRNTAGTWTPPARMAPWRERPSWGEIRSYRTPRGNVDLVEKLRREPGVSVVAGSPGKGRVAVFSADGEGLIRAEGEGEGAHFAYEIVSGGDPLGCRGTPAAALMDGRFHPSREWLKATGGLARPDIVAQLPSLFESPCRGELYVVASDDGCFEDGNVSEHGGFLRGEMCVPLLVAGPGIRKGAFGPVRIVDVAPTILDYLGHGDRIAGAGLDGASFLKEISAP